MASKNYQTIRTSTQFCFGRASAWVFQKRNPFPEVDLDNIGLWSHAFTGLASISRRDLGRELSKKKKSAPGPGLWDEVKDRLTSPGKQPLLGGPTSKRLCIARAIAVRTGSDSSWMGHAQRLDPVATGGALKENSSTEFAPKAFYCIVHSLDSTPCSRAPVCRGQETPTRPFFRSGGAENLVPKIGFWGKN